MLHLALALAVFLILHLIPVIPGMRDRMIERLGRPGYIALHSVLSTLTLIWLILATLWAPVVVLWPMAGWQAWVTIGLMPVALFLLVAGLISPNPLSLSLRPGATDTRSGIARITRHPVFWGALLWALSHIPPNGDLRSVLLFGSMAALAAAGFALGDRRARRKLGARWDALAATSSVIPFLAMAQGRTRLRIDLPMVIAALLAAGLSAWLLHGGHAALFGVDPLTSTGF
ncbi:NnrU family protein [Pelagibacterium lacus]|uniref:NnrU family protein n=1 Tax=Pelagibacterium lacus TaxID=2282655 RepID=UPI0018F65B75|nr:NnrU family protein [Pelagibacterium lacus]